MDLHISRSASRRFLFAGTLAGFLKPAARGQAPGGWQAGPGDLAEAVAAFSAALANRLKYEKSGDYERERLTVQVLRGLAAYESARARKGETAAAVWLQPLSVAVRKAAAVLNLLGNDPGAFSAVGDDLSRVIEQVG